MLQLHKGTIRKYYKYQAWIQPILTSNGTMGGGSFACTSSTAESSYPAWKAFDGDKVTNTSRWGATSSSVPQWLSFYNPTKIMVTNIAITQRSNTTDHLTSGIIQVSDDNINWIDIKNWTNNNSTAGATWDIDLSDNINSYKYYRIYITGYSHSSGTWVSIVEATITAFTITEGTSSDYDYYEDVEVLQAPSEYDYDTNSVKVYALNR